MSFGYACVFSFFFNSNHIVDGLADSQLTQKFADAAQK